MRHALVLATLALPLTALPAFADCKADVRAVMEKSISSGPYRMETTTTVMGETTTSTLELVPPNAMRTRSEAGGVVIESVFVGKRGWMNMDGTWSELPAEMAGTIDQLFSSNALDTLVDMVDETCGAQEMREGRMVATYSYSYRTDELISHNTILVDVGTGLPIEISNAASLAGSESTSFSRYIYDGSISIEAPL